MADSLAPPSGEAVPRVKAKLFGKTKSVHGMLGGGHAADVLLWRKWQISAGILSVATVAWFLFEWSGYTLLTFIANAALIAILGIFAWAQAAALFKLPPPPVPEFHLTEEQVHRLATVFRREVNGALAVAHNVAMGRDYFAFAKVIFGLYILAHVGSWFSTLTLFFLVVLLAFTVPVFYEKYEDQVDHHIKYGLDQAHSGYKVVHEKVRTTMKKIPAEEKAKKIE